MIDAAKKYRNIGLSIIPCTPNKVPALESWIQYQKTIMAEAEIENSFKGVKCLAVICGQVSDNTEIIDFDQNAAALGVWSLLIQEKVPSLFDKLVLERSPHGAHIAYRCPGVTIPGNTKLAMTPDKKVLIETRGTGGYCLISPSQGYELVQGSFLNLPELAQEEREVLIESARELNQFIQPQAPKNKQDAATLAVGLLPGQDFDERGDLRTLLLKHEWKPCGTGQDGRERWARPGKSKGYSATLTGGKVFYVFSSNAEPFESGKGYGPFGVYTILEYGGDYEAATRALSEKGYGSQQKRNPEPKTRTAGPSMGDLREYIEQCVVPGQKITTDEICRGLACYKREERKTIYTYIGRLCDEGILVKDTYQHGGYRRVTSIDAYDMSGDINTDEILFDVKLPLDLHNLLKIKPSHLFQVSGRYDAGKSSFLFQVEADNYHDNRIVHIVSDEWSLDSIKERMDILKIPRPHPNIKVIPMRPGYEDMIPRGRCITLIDYIRGDENPFQTDAQIQRVLQRLDGGICIFATQKHPGLDRPVGGQFAVHASHHIVMLDKWKDYFICKVFRSKNERNLEGYFKTFKILKDKRLYPCMDNWKQGGIKWDKKPLEINDNNDNNDNNFGVVKWGGPDTLKEKERIKEKENYNINMGIEDQQNFLRGIL